MKTVILCVPSNPAHATEDIACACVLSEEMRLQGWSVVSDVMLPCFASHLRDARLTFTAGTRLTRADAIEWLVSNWGSQIIDSLAPLSEVFQVFSAHYAHYLPVTDSEHVYIRRTMARAASLFPCTRAGLLAEMPDYSMVASGAGFYNQHCSTETWMGKVFSGVSFGGIAFERITFVGCLFVNCNFEGCTFAGCSFVGGTLTGNVYAGGWQDCTGQLDCLEITAHDLRGMVRVHLTAEQSSGSIDTTDLETVTLPKGIVIERSCLILTRRSHTCLLCGKRGAMRKLRKGKWLCSRCEKNKGGHSDINTTYIGRPEQHMPCFSIEIETDGPREAMEKTLVLLAHGCIATQDVTVSTEYKSPIFVSLRASLPVLRACDSFAAEAINDNCGTHLHVDCPVKHALHRDLFARLNDHLQQDPDKTERFFGRYFGSYSQNSTGYNRYNAFSLHSNHETIEYRLPVFREMQQYLRVIRFARAATRRIIDYYSYTPQGLRDVSVIGRAIVEIYKEHAANV